MPGRNGRAFWAYLLLQVPEILLAGLIFLLLHWWVGLSHGWAIGLFALWILKELVTYLLVRNAFEAPSMGPATLVGARAVARERLAPEGYILVSGEWWRAESLRPQEVIAPGTPVIVRSLRGLTLLVECEGSAGAPDGTGWEG